MIRTWCKSSYSGQENTCLELLTPPRQDRPPFVTRSALAAR
nr:DUF397 domain-containing protein [Streptomyces griseochromogenes]